VILNSGTVIFTFNLQNTENKSKLTDKQTNKQTQTHITLLDFHWSSSKKSKTFSKQKLRAQELCKATEVVDNGGHLIIFRSHC